MIRATTNKEIRRLKVKQLLLSGVVGGREITRRLQKLGWKTSHATTSRDIQRIEKEMAEDVTPEKVEMYRIQQLMKINEMEKVIALASLGVRPGDKTSDPGYQRDIDLAIKAQRARRDLLNDQAKLLGLHAAQDINLVNIGELKKLMIAADDEEDLVNAINADEHND